MSDRDLAFLQAVPERLLERVRVVSGGEANVGGEFVLYWLHHAMRTHENPALDVAAAIANELTLPLLVYQSIPERYPYASDRHHRFMLEGVRDLQHQFSERGIAYAFHLERRGHRGPHLYSLCNRAAVTVTEEMPVEPLRTWTKRIAAVIRTPLLCVDTACVVPMRVVGKAYDRAFQFRKATETMYADRLCQPWDDVPANRSHLPPDLPFKPLCLSDTNLAQVISSCDIDHAIGPVPHTRGGSVAGYARWDHFKSGGLDAYARLRNDPLAEGTSRLSAYLHYGMVSPLRIGREAAASRSGGADKFLDELLIWREMAYLFCFHRTDLGRLAALPGWARETLASHESDRRPAVYSWETLARAKTGDPLWDAAQRSLLQHGELHNNVRMTWGKALLKWTTDAQSALDVIIDLNHRYALDGRDPASYGGILWCLGQFDRPFPPERPILGTVRDRTTEHHAKRLDVDRYAMHTARRLCDPAPSVAVVGAGISGLMCARTLKDHGIPVAVFEKSRGLGGRMATRRTDHGDSFDHGAQYFTVRDARFERYVRSWMHDGIVARWQARIGVLRKGEVEFQPPSTKRYVGTPGMNAVCRHLAADLTVQLGTEVVAAQRDRAGWTIRDDQGVSLGQFDYVITSAPAPQSAQLLAAAPDLQSRAEHARMDGCWAIMLAFEQSLNLPFDGAFVAESPIAWMSRNSSKPGRANDSETWVVHASAEWTNNFLEEEPGKVLALLSEAFWQATHIEPKTSRVAVSHRWRYAKPSEPDEERCLFDSRLRIGTCGDWCSGSRVEDSFLSGMAIAGRVLSDIPSWKAKRPTHT